MIIARRNVHCRFASFLGWVVVVSIAGSADWLQARDHANAELVEMVVGFLADSDQDIRALAYDQIRTAAPGAVATQRFAAELPKLTLPAQIGLVGALADRGDTAAKPAITALLTARSDQSLQVAAIRAIGKLGDASDCPKLIELLATPTAAISTAARRSLVELRGQPVLTAIVSTLGDVRPATRIVLIEILTDRRALAAIPTLLELAVGQEASVRAAAMTSLGQLAGPEHVAAMTQGVLTAEKGAERSAAEKNLMFVCNRIADKDQRAEPLLGAVQHLKPNEQVIMLSTLGRIGGTAALTEIDQAIASPQPERHAAGVQAITNWPDASVAARLFALAKTDAHEGHRKRARKALMRIAPLPDGRTDDEKLELLQAAFKLAESDVERNYALTRAAAIRIVDTLRFLVTFLDEAPTAEQACQSIVELAHHRQLRDDHKQEFHAALDKVMGITNDQVVLERAKRYKQGKTWVRPK